MEKIKKIVEEFLGAMTINEARVAVKKDNSLKDKELLKVEIELSPKEAKYFFAENALGLNAFQRILRMLVFRDNPSQAVLVADMNNYREEREKFLSELAVKVAQRVRRTKKPVTLEPMSAYERRFIHLKLAEQPDIVTESIGEEPERRIMVRLYP
ncbi:MAG: hypothetical protein COU82_00830 [Candidatus Portnoybacteria bacterium CG10_big_fil_rev_8_21_14_0_10_38_18]|uniref:R3H domain-containing protein n=1 Tax=Candidatus Portnoybacteria bacterium CG10_big_fil_rev_8_21_14_0_10_38_18 TaxID=1974813 RepID=A0A2M8KCJ5_9BACT|nr:MAG: hypothetical protein COU82_00830 [Candidatus Portnoybacteria bacterium CG10_big_fil_rev_8_21_14_0_10_38_18]